MIINDIEIKESNRFDLQRRAVSHMTTESWKNVPHVSYIYEADITDFFEEFKVLTKTRHESGYKITVNTIMMKVIAEGLLAAPNLNSYIEYDHTKTEGTTHILGGINMSIPWNSPDGRMITPTIPNIEKMSLNDISDYITKLAKRIEKTNIDEMFYQAASTVTVNAEMVSESSIRGMEGKEKENYYKIPEDERLTEKDIMSGTVTVSNIGSLYKEQSGFFGLLEIIPPQVFAVGISSIQEKPGVFLNQSGNKEIGIRKILPMCLVFDHRAVDFSSIVPFLKRLDEIFAEPNIIQKW